MRDGKPNMTFPLSRLGGRYTDVICDDAVELTLQYSTQWDSLAHMGQMFDADGDGIAEMVFYNGFRAVEDIAGPVDYRGATERDLGGHSGARALGIEHMAERCIQGRGVMIDLAAHFGESAVLVGYDQLMRIMEADQIEVEQGDMICMRTGFDRVLLAMGKSPDAARLAQTGAALDGRDDTLLKWITDSGVVALIADNPAVERLPNLCCEAHAFAFHPLHDHCLFRLGVYLGELWLLSDLADWLRNAGRSRFLLTAPPLRLPGAVGSPVTPVATV
jgi:kynurenine formamidase